MSIKVTKYRRAYNYIFNNFWKGCDKLCFKCKDEFKDNCAMTLLDEVVTYYEANHKNLDIDSNESEE